MTDNNNGQQNDLHPADSRQQTELPKEIFEELFGDQPAGGQTNPGSAEQASTTKHAEDVEDILREQSLEPSREPALQPAPEGRGTVTSAAPRAAGGPRKASGAARTVSGLLGRVSRKFTGKEPGGWLTGSNGADAMGGAATNSDDSLQELEARMKVSLRESSLASIGKIGVGGLKGGVGKSSTAYGVASALAYYTNMRVVCVDVEPNFGSIRLMMPHPIQPSVVDLARDADELDGLTDLRNYIAQNEKMRLDAVLGPEHAYELAAFEDLGEIYRRVDRVLSRHYDIIVYDLGIGFRDSAIRKVLELCNELLFVSDGEVIPNAMLKDGVTFIRNLGIDLERTTLVVNHRLPKEHESADTAQIKQAARQAFRRVTDIQYDDYMSQLVNRRALHVESLRPLTRCGILATAGAALEGLMNSVESGRTVSASTTATTNDSRGQTTGKEGS